MKVRKIAIFTGKKFVVPQGIQRIDHAATHGWQLRYGGTKLYSDGARNGSGAAAALARATDELVRRIARLPAPDRLQLEPNENKTSDLPVGISGPIVRLRKGAKVHDCSFSVSLPRFGEKPRRHSVYIANENTWSVEKYERALVKAIALRDEAEAAYRRATTTAKRAGARRFTAS
jgi:hypothetical protein